jgi:tetratricopeptide (TPR) repeat protein/tRNA A-37 threonylcarbamoyl transferase component Bud32
MQPESPSLRTLFDTAHELHGAARAAFLAGLDPAQRTYLERLLAAADADTTDGALKVDAASLVAALDEPAAPPLPVTGQQVGAWELLALIGEGGSSTVFRAAREHSGVLQEAALKLLRRSLYTADAQRQFRRERQALAQLSHPDIASLIEGGVTDNGLAYIVLEFVDGVPITEYVRVNALDLRARLRLFLRVCRAVESAHRALIVHRDLKPSNVLVTGEGHVKLLDFGIAKLLDADDETQTKLPAFTPAYAAPEQRSGALITTATDVYALGILLGELMTGQRLTTGDSRTPSGQIVDDSAPGVLPATPKLTRRQLRGDLDNIVLKAIAEEPERRYASAGAMADDIERLLDGRPVVAHPPSRWYRTRKFVQRHRGGVAITALFLIAILASLGLALWQAEVARNEAQRANAVRDFVVGVFDTARAHLPRDQRPTPEKLVAQAEQRLAKSALDDNARADVLRTLGEVSLSLANFSDAEKTLREARALAQRAGDADGARHALVLHAKALQGAGRNADAKREIDADIAAMRAAPSADLFGALSVLTQAEMATGAPDAALAHQREAVTAATGMYGPDHIELLSVTFESGEMLAQAQRYPEAIAALEPALARWRSAGDPEDDRYVTALASLAAAADGMGDSAKSEQRLRELLALKQRIYTPPHDAIAATLRELALIVGRDGARDKEADALLAQALSMQRQVFGNDHAEIAETHEARGNILAAQRRFDEAEVAYREALAVCERAAIRSEVCPRARNDLGMTFYRRNRPDEAEAEMRQALAERRALFGNDHPSVAYSLSTLSDVALKQKKKQLGIDLAAEALVTMQRAGRGSSREAVLIHNSYATALWWSDRNAEALPEIEATLADWQRVAPEAKPRRVMMLLLKAQVFDELGRKDDARLVAEEAIALDVPADRLQATTRKQLRELSRRSDVYPEATDPSK